MMTATLPQGHLDLIHTDTAQELLGSRLLARVAYVAHDGTPRVLPIFFHWTGEELVLPTFAGSHKVAALRARPDVAVTIDSPGPPPNVLMLRGSVTVDDVDGLLPEYALAHRRYAADPAQAEAAIAQAEGAPMVRIALRPTWVGVLDFVTRFPGGGRS
jgi:hypothetical protein